MSTRLRRLFIITAACLTGGVAVTGVLAHPPDNPYDNTIFAPIEDEAGTSISLSPTASGLTAPLKGKQAPGESGRMYVVDQAGKLWAIELATGNKIVMLNVTSRLVPLGVVGAGKLRRTRLPRRGLSSQLRQQRQVLHLDLGAQQRAAQPFPTTLRPAATADHQNVLAEWQANGPGNPAGGWRPSSAS